MEIRHVHYIIGASFVLVPGGTDIFLIDVQAVDQKLIFEVFVVLRRAATGVENSFVMRVSRIDDGNDLRGLLLVVLEAVYKVVKFCAVDEQGVSSWSNQPIG
jgi:hypothetical protein